jgi:hypothetical protein
MLRPLFVVLYVLFWPLHCLFLELRLLCYHFDIFKLFIQTKHRTIDFEVEFQRILCWIFFLGGGFFFLYLVYPMLPVFLDCPFFIAPTVFSNVYIETTSNESSPSHLNIIICNYLSIYVELFLVDLLVSST